MDLYTQLDKIEQQCTSRRLSKADTRKLMGLCIYAFVNRFPAREQWTPARRDKVLTACQQQALAILN